MRYVVGFGEVVVTCLVNVVTMFVKDTVFELSVDEVQGLNG